MSSLIFRALHCSYYDSYLHRLNGDVIKAILYVVAICTIIVYVVKTLPKINPEENIMWKSEDTDKEEVLEAVE